jgi:hypothetical protein
MTVKYNQSRYDMLDSPMTDSFFSQGYTEMSLAPPPGSQFMITEVTSEIMISESGDYMITEAIY